MDSSSISASATATATASTPEGSEGRSNVIPLIAPPAKEGGSPWSKERAELVRRTICPKGISEDEFALFVEQCKRSGLDPLLKEAFCVARRQNVGNRERPNWVTKYEFQPSEAGMLARAERFPDFRGIQASAVFAEDDILVNQGKGEVHHTFNPAKRKGALVGAWSRVVRDNKLPVVVWLDFSGYVQQTPLWAKIPSNMIEKCARVAALRKAYPEAFGGLYVREEMPAEDYVAPGDPNYSHEQWTSEPSSHQKRTVAQPDRKAMAFQKLTDNLVGAGLKKQDVAAFCSTVIGDATPWSEWNATQLARVQAAVLRYVKENAVPQTQPQPASASEAAPISEGAPSTEDDIHSTEAEPAESDDAPSTEAGTESKHNVVVAFGPYKGKTASELSDEELSDTVDMAHEKLMEQPKARWAKAMRDNLAALEAEVQLRCRVPASPAHP